jgi:hypothetical protein
MMWGCILFFKADPSIGTQGVFGTEIIKNHTVPLFPFRLTVPRGWFPASHDPNRILIPGPGRHRDDQESEGLPAGVPELEMGALWYGQAHSRAHLDNLLTPSLPPPDLPLPADEIPYLIDTPVADSQRCALGLKGTMGETTASQFNEWSDLRSVGGQLELILQTLRSELDYCKPLS